MHWIIPILAEVSSAKDLWELWSFQAVVAATLITLVSAVVTGGFAVWQWRKELRWKQAELARILLDEIFDYGPSNDAWRMVDGEKLYKDDQGNEYHITMDLVRQALPKPWNDERSGSNLYVRWCFDALFYYLERLDQSVKIKLVRIEDLTAPTALLHCINVKG